MKYRESLVIYLKGMLMGVADIIPGVSGGTMALITNIYERLIRAITNIDFKFVVHLFRGNFKAAKRNFLSIDFALLVPLALGIITAVIVMVLVLGSLMHEYQAFVFAFFFGLILASAGIVYNYVERLDVKNFVFMVLGFILVFWVVGLKEFSDNHSPPMIFLSGVIAICAMILPGISGALIMLILGQYKYMFGTLESFIHSPGMTDELMDILYFMSGAVLGLVAFSRFLDYLIRKHRSVTMSFLLGLMLGALRAPATEVANDTELTDTLKMAGVVIAALVGILMIIIIQKKSNIVETIGKSNDAKSQESIDNVDKENSNIVDSESSQIVENEKSGIIESNEGVAKEEQPNGES